MSEQNIGTKLEQILQQKRITQDALVEMTKKNGRPVSKRTISRIIAGACRTHRNDTMKDLAGVLGVSVEELLGTAAIGGSVEAPAPTMTQPLAGTSDPKSELYDWEMIRIPLKLAKSTRDLEDLLSSPGVRFERRWLEDEDAEDRVALIFQKVLDGRERWWGLNLVERREVLKEILELLKEERPGALCPIELYVGFTRLSVEDRRGEHLGEGKYAVVVADSFGTVDAAWLEHGASINIDSPVQHC